MGGRVNGVMKEPGVRRLPDIGPSLVPTAAVIGQEASLVLA